jgi:lipoic acid synthetase
MIGIGESIREIEEVIKELSSIKIDIITIGQYYQPSEKCIKVKKVYTDEEFEEIAELAKIHGIPHVYSGRFVRSSFISFDIFNDPLKNNMKIHNSASIT